MNNSVYKDRIRKCCRLMKVAGLDVLLLTKPSNMFYLTGDGRLCAFAMITQKGKVALGVPQTDVKDVKSLAYFDHLVGFEDEVGMIHSIAHYFKEFDIQKGTLGLEHTFLTGAMMNMLTHPHAKPEEVAVKDCTPILSELRIVKDDEEIEHIRASAKVALTGMKAAVESRQAGAHRESDRSRGGICDAASRGPGILAELMFPPVPGRISPMDYPRFVNLRRAIW